MKQPIPLPRIVCPLCRLSQQWNRQTICLHCGQPMPAFAIASQINPQINRN